MHGIREANNNNLELFGFLVTVWWIWFAPTRNVRLIEDLSIDQVKPTNEK